MIGVESLWEAHSSSLPMPCWLNHVEPKYPHGHTLIFCGEHHTKRTGPHMSILFGFMLFKLSSFYVLVNFPLFLISLLACWCQGLLVHRRETWNKPYIVIRAIVEAYISQLLLRQRFRCTCTFQPIAPQVFVLKTLLFLFFFFWDEKHVKSLHTCREGLSEWPAARSECFRFVFQKTRKKNSRKKPMKLSKS